MTVDDQVDKPATYAFSGTEGVQKLKWLVGELHRQEAHHWQGTFSLQGKALATAGFSTAILTILVSTDSVSGQHSVFLFPFVILLIIGIVGSASFAFPRSSASGLVPGELVAYGNDPETTEIELLTFELEDVLRRISIRKKANKSAQERLALSVIALGLAVIAAVSHSYLSPQLNPQENPQYGEEIEEASSEESRQEGAQGRQEGRQESAQGRQEGSQGRQEGPKGRQEGPKDG